MAYVEVYDQATTLGSLKKQVAVAIHKAAVDIGNEDPQTANHANRLFWARQAAADPVGWADKAIWIVMENATIAASPASATDSDVQFVVNSSVNKLLRL
jgi:hypothetical protein